MVHKGGTQGTLIPRHQGGSPGTYRLGPAILAIQVSASGSLVSRPSTGFHDIKGVMAFDRKDVGMDGGIPFTDRRPGGGYGRP
jgi:hypothetical protein